MGCSLPYSRYSGRKLILLDEAVLVFGRGEDTLERQGTTKCSHGSFCPSERARMHEARNCSHPRVQLRGSTWTSEHGWLPLELVR